MTISTGRILPEWVAKPVQAAWRIDALAVNQPNIWQLYPNGRHPDRAQISKYHRHRISDPGKIYPHYNSGTAIHSTVTVVQPFTRQRQQYSSSLHRNSGTALHSTATKVQLSMRQQQCYRPALGSDSGNTLYNRHRYEYMGWKSVPSTSPNPRTVQDCYSIIKMEQFHCTHCKFCKKGRQLHKTNGCCLLVI